MQREKIKMIPGVPLTVLLDDGIGRPMSSRFHDGTEYLYNVEHRGSGCLLYLPVEGHQALRRLEAAAGDEIQILKTQTQGQSPQFTARRVSDAELVVPTHQDAPVRGVRMLAPQTQAVAAPRPAPPTTQVSDSASSGTAVLMAQCLHCAIDAAIGAETFAAAKGKTLAFNEEDIRAIALSIYINKSKEGRY